MTSIAQEKPATATAASVERAVFVTDDDRRSRIARRLAFAALGVATLWLAALAVGMLGLGRLPGVSLPLPGVAKAKQQEQRPSTQPPVRNTSIESTTPLVRSNAAAVVHTSAATPATTPRARAQASAAAPRQAKGPGRRRAAAPVRTAVPQPATARRVARGLDRRGLTAPRGQTQKAAAAPKTTARDQTKTPKGQVKQADAAQAAPQPQPAPPGQQKPDKPPPKA
jgi:hypothetical protein